MRRLSTTDRFVCGAWTLRKGLNTIHIVIFVLSQLLFCYRLRAARVLIVGLKGLGAEISKNLILAGVKSLTMMDSENAEPEDMQHQFLIPESDIGKNVIKNDALLS